LIFDFSNQRFMAVNRTEAEARLFDSLDEEVKDKLFPHHNSFERAFVFDKSSRVSLAKIRPGEVVRMGENSSFEFLASQFGVPQLPAFGISGWNRPWNSTLLKNRLDQVMNPDTMETVTHVGPDRYRAFFRVATPGGSLTGGSRYAIDWDVNRMVPVKLTTYVGYDDDFSTKPYSEDRVEWREVNSQYVPVMLRGTRPRRLDFEGRDFRMKEEIEVQLRWFSINEDIPDSSFDKEQLSDPAKLAELIADSLLNE